MSVTGVKLPPDSDPSWLAYSRLVNADAPTPELQRERVEMRLRLGAVLEEAKVHFWECDSAKLDLLLVEREEITEQAQALLDQIGKLQQKNAMHTVSQPRLQENLQRAQERLREFVPINRTVSTLAEIEADKTEELELKKAVTAAKIALNSNAQDIFATHPPQQELQRQYRELQDREQSITEAIEQLRLPPEQRRKHSSIVWQGEGGEVYMAQVPFRA